MSEARLPSAEELTEILKRNSGVLLAVGGVQIALGLAAIAAPQLATTIGVEFLAVLLCGAAGLAVGVMLVAEWPGDAVWAIGLLLGINLLMGGASLAGLAMAARSGGGPKPA